MENIKGKVLVTTDWHIGLKQNSKSRLNIIVQVVKELLAYIKKNDVKTIMFCGDLFHERVAVNVNSLNVALKCIQALSKYCKIYLIVGNHDSHLKNSIDINSLNIFKDTPNVVIVSKPTQISINNNVSLMVPWLGDLTSFSEETFDMVFGHFDVSQKYLIKSYIEEHSQKASISDKVENEIKFDSILSTETTSNVGDYVGDFVDVAKKTGTVFSGHIHGRKEFISKGRKFVLVGDPYQQNLGEKEYSCGFYVIDESNKHKFVSIDNVPKHIEIKMSKVVKDIESFDFSIVKGNILHKVYDVEVATALDAKISQIINDWHPYEELLPDYDVDLNLNFDMKLQNESIELIKKSKLDYVKNYILNIDKKVLEEQKIEQDKLYTVLAEYYNKVTEDK